MSTRWEDRAACRGTVTSGVITSPETDIFYPGNNPALTIQGLAYCAVCPTTRECHDLLQIVPKKEGIWGGKLRNETADRTSTNPADINARRRQLYDYGMSDSAIGKAEGVTKSAIRYWRQQHGLELVTPEYRPTSRALLQRREMYDQGQSDNQIAHFEGVGRDVIRSWRRRNKLHANKVGVTR